MEGLGVLIQSICPMSLASLSDLAELIRYLRDTDADRSIQKASSDGLSEMVRPLRPLTRCSIH